MENNGKRQKSLVENLYRDLSSKKLVYTVDFRNNAMVD